MRILGMLLVLLSSCGTEYLLGRLDAERSGPDAPELLAPEPGDTFLVQFVSGPSRWSQDGLIWAFDGWGARGVEWRPLTGDEGLSFDGAPQIRPGPFTDAAPAVAGAFGATGQLRSPTAEHTLEIVFRASSEGALVQSAPWGDLITSEGVLLWRRGSAEVRSAALAPDAWAHCGAGWSAGRAQVVCNGVAGAPGELPAPATGGPSALTVVRRQDRQVAWLAGHGARLDPEALRARFLALTGVEPTMGNGQVRFPIRSSAAALTTVEDGTRWLHRVGLNWPRVACWTEEQCGLWTEPGRSPLALERWRTEGLELLAEEQWRGSDARTAEWRADGPGPHALRLLADTEATRRVLSFFVSAAESVEVATAMGSLQARFRVGGTAPEPLVLPDDGAGRVEVWDPATPERAGLHRVVWSQPVSEGELQISIELVASSGGGLPPGRIGPPQFDRSQVGLPVLGDQEEDQLSYPGGDNLPGGDSGRVEASFFLPWLPGPGQSTVVNLSREGRFGDQINVFVAGEGQMLFWGLRNDDSRWGFGLPGPAGRVDDGGRHEVAGSWGPLGATLDVDGQTERQGDATAAGTHLGLDRIDLGNSLESSGPLFGGISTLRITMP